MKIIVFFGSGISLPSGYPSTQDLTYKLFDKPVVSKGEWLLVYTTPKEYTEHLKKYNLSVDSYEIRIQKLLKLIENSIREAYRDKYPSCENIIITYEDIYEVINSLYWYLCTSRDEILAYSFIKHHEKEFEPLLIPLPGDMDPLKLRHLIKETKDFISLTVKDYLSKQTLIEGLTPLKRLLLDERFEKIDIFTLNHDLLIERFMEQENISYWDGFGEKDGDLRLLDQNRFIKNRSERINLYKLHGSINWYQYQSNKGINYGISDKQYPKDSNGNIWVTHDLSVPHILTGTTNKYTAYNEGIFKVLMHRFQQSLYETNTILMSGYGWKDGGINTRLANWSNFDSTNKMLILHNNPNEIIHSLSYLWLPPENQLIFIPKWLSTVSYEEIEKELFQQKN